MISINKGDVTERYISMVTSNHTPILSLFGQYDQVKIMLISVYMIMCLIIPYHSLFNGIRKFSCVITNICNKQCDVFGDPI